MSDVVLFSRSEPGSGSGWLDSDQPRWLAGKALGEPMSVWCPQLKQKAIATHGWMFFNSDIFAKVYYLYVYQLGLNYLKINKMCSVIYFQNLNVRR